MADAKVTSKGQITIPKAVRERLHLEAGDRVSFDIRDDHTVVIRAKNLPIERLFGMLYDPTAKPLTIKEMNPGNDPNYTSDVRR